MLTIVIILIAVASHTHCHFNPPFKKQNKPFVLSERYLTWKQQLTYGTRVRLKIRLQAARTEKTGQRYFLDWTLPTVLAKRLHISNHLALGVYDPLSPINTSLIQPVTHARCHLAMNASERPHPPPPPPQKKPTKYYPMSASKFPILPRLLLIPSIVNRLLNGSLRAHSHLFLCV